LHSLKVECKRTLELFAATIESIEKVVSALERKIKKAVDSAKIIRANLQNALIGTDWRENTCNGLS
jgi:DNA-binding protein